MGQFTVPLYSGKLPLKNSWVPILNKLQDTISEKNQDARIEDLYHVPVDT